jgi:hypothetical protein
MSKNVILYERTEGGRMYRIVPGDTTHALVEELFVIEVWEDEQCILTSAPFLTLESAKKRIKENANNLRTCRMKHGKES